MKFLATPSATGDNTLPNFPRNLDTMLEALFITPDRFEVVRKAFRAACAQGTIHVSDIQFGASYQHFRYECELNLFLEQHFSNAELTQIYRSPTGLEERVDDHYMRVQVATMWEVCLLLRKEVLREKSLGQLGNLNFNKMMDEITIEDDDKCNGEGFVEIEYASSDDSDYVMGEEESGITTLHEVEAEVPAWAAYRWKNEYKSNLALLVLEQYPYYRKDIRDNDFYTEEWDGIVKKIYNFLKQITPVGFKFPTDSMIVEWLENESRWEYAVHNYEEGRKSWDWSCKDNYVNNCARIL